MTNWMKKSFFLLIVVPMTMLAACSQDGAVNGVNKAAALTAQTLGEQSLIGYAEYLASDEFAVADVARGERIAMQCRACHSFEAGGADMIGPALHGFLGKAAGSRGEFAYTSVLTDAAFLWTPRALDAWLAQPANFLPGNRMIFAGMRDSGSRQALVAYLLDVTNDTGRE